MYIAPSIERLWREWSRNKLNICGHYTGLFRAWVDICTWFKWKLATVHTYTTSPLHCTATAIAKTILEQMRCIWAKINAETIQTAGFLCSSRSHFIYPFHSAQAHLSPLIAFTFGHCCENRCNQHTKPNLWLFECALHNSIGNGVAVLALFSLFFLTGDSIARIHHV